MYICYILITCLFPQNMLSAKLWNHMLRNELNTMKTVKQLLVFLGVGGGWNRLFPPCNNNANAYSHTMYLGLWIHVVLVCIITDNFCMDNLPMIKMFQVTSWSSQDLHRKLKLISKLKQQWQTIGFGNIIFIEGTSMFKNVRWIIRSDVKTMHRIRPTLYFVSLQPLSQCCLFSSSLNKIPSFSTLFPSGHQQSSKKSHGSPGIQSNAIHLLNSLHQQRDGIYCVYLCWSAIVLMTLVLHTFQCTSHCSNPNL